MKETPSRDAVIKYFFENGLDHEIAEAFYYHQVTHGWKNTKSGEVTKNWKNLAVSWMLRFTKAYPVINYFLGKKRKV